jgi:hypothetical protein
VLVVLCGELLTSGLGTINIPASRFDNLLYYAFHHLLVLQPQVTGAPSAQLILAPTNNEFPHLGKSHRAEIKPRTLTGAAYKIRLKQSQFRDNGRGV